MTKAYCTIYKHNGLYYNIMSRNTFVRTLSNVDVYFPTIDKFIDFTQKYGGTSKIANHVFGNGVYTSIVAAIFKFYDVDSYNDNSTFVTSKSVTKSTQNILNVITDDEAHEVFNFYITHHQHADGSFIVNGEQTPMTIYQIKSAAVLYMLNHRSTITKEIDYTKPVDKYILSRKSVNDHVNESVNTVVKPPQTVDDLYMQIVDKEHGHHTDKITYNLYSKRIKENIEKFSKCIPDEDKEKYRAVSDIVKAILSIGKESPDKDANSKAIVEVLGMILVGKPHLKNMFSVILGQH